jgi:hypothetical protein
MSILSYTLRGSSTLLGLGLGIYTFIPSIIAIALKRQTGYISLTGSILIMFGGILSPFIDNIEHILYFYCSGGLLFLISYV